MENNNSNNANKDNTNLKLLLSSSLSFSQKDNLGSGDSFESEYINKYKESALSIAKSKEWKASGATYDHYDSAQPQNMYSKINDICGFSDTSCLYAVQAGDISAIIKKDFKDDVENHIMHSNSEKFLSIDYSKHDNKVIASVAKGFYEKNIVSLNLDTNDYRVLTAGDSSDEYPSFSAYDDKILFSSRGIARTASLEFVRYSDSSIYYYDKKGNIEEIISEQGFDLISPKTDKDNNLYYIRKPYSKQKKSKNIGSTILNILTFPFYLVYSIFKFLFFIASLSKKSSDRSQSKTSGNNPAVDVQKSEQDLMIYEQRVSLSEKEEKTLKGEKISGYAPKNFELWKMTPQGEKIKLASNVFDYDVSIDGEIVYTNGKYVFLLTSQENKILFKDKLILRLSYNDTIQKNIKQNNINPFE